MLIVGVNSDDSVRNLKGPSRPIISEKDRVKILSALSIVDYVVIFNEDTPEKMIRDIMPDVIVKGEEYRNKHVSGSDIIKEYGGRVEFIKLIDGISTTNIIENVKHK